MQRIRFNFVPAKVIDAVSWMLWIEEKNGKDKLDFQTILKSCYFADKEALVMRRRPIFGARYVAMQYGPVPTEIYEMLKCEPIWLVELAEENVTEYPWDQKNHFLSLKMKKKNRIEHKNIAVVEMNIIKKAFEKCSDMDFNKRTHDTHEKDWYKGTKRPKRLMHYEDMIPVDVPDRKELIEDLLEDGFNYAL